MEAHECPATVRCSKCDRECLPTDFYGHSRQCKKCWLERCARYREENQEKIKRYLKKWYSRNRDRVLDRCKTYNAKSEVKEREKERQRARYSENRDAIQASRRQYYDSNPDARNRFLEYQRQYYEGNRIRFLVRGAKRRAARKQAFPKWADPAKIAEFYLLAERKTRETGIRHVVDHIVPLQGKKVCGLHVEFNLQVLTEDENLRKFNKFG